MALETVTNDAVAIYLDSADLCSLGLDGKISGKAARAIVVRALKARGEAPWPDMEVDLFTCDNSVLLLARPSRKQTHCFSFDSFELLLSAVHSISEDIPSLLFHYDGRFYLYITETIGCIPFALFEFGEMHKFNPELNSHINEHGETIIAADAISVLKEKFST